MPIVAYNTFVGAIKTSIEAYGSNTFKYVSRDRWLDDEGKLLQALVNNSFSIFISGKLDDESLESITDQLLELDIQFALDGKHDNYLSTLGHCEAAIREILGLSYGEIKKTNYNPDLELIPDGDKVRAIFTVNYIIRNQ